MTKEELISQADIIIQFTDKNIRGGFAQAKQFLSSYGGKNNTFLQTLEAVDEKIVYRDYKYIQGITRQVLASFKEYVANDLLRSISLEREIQIETVSDYLGQAESLLNDTKVHPAAPAVLIGASLEEFLRNWLEEEGEDLTTIKNSLDAYTQRLKQLEKISKQDIKDITPWGGTRNSAAHGHWEEVEDRKRIKLMLEGVNLFIRKYSENK